MTLLFWIICVMGVLASLITLDIMRKAYNASRISSDNPWAVSAAWGLVAMTLPGLVLSIAKIEQLVNG